MIIKQVTSFVGNLFAVFALAICAGIVNSQLHGELHDWSMLLEVIADSALYGVVAVAGWILLKSPFASHRFTSSDLEKAARTGSTEIK
tara:strand:- start:409 stop:672 length:264 start_codon:yes stop_codon:yes gene_type:complete